MADRKTPRSNTGTGRKPAARKSGATSARSVTRRTSAPERDSHGRFKADHHVRNAAVGTAAALGVAAAGIAAAFRFGLLDRFLPAGEGHSAEDLLIEDGARPTGRAPADFRPDMDAPMTKAEKEALRPARGKPSLAASEGELASQ